MIPQLPLDITLPSSSVFANFMSGDNALLVRMLQAASAGPTADHYREASVYIWGEEGVGKTHLLQACCAGSGECRRSSVYLPLGTLRQHGAGVLDGMSEPELICLDDIHLVIGQREWEAGLFNLINECRQKQHCLVMAGNNAPASMPCVRQPQTSLGPSGSSWVPSRC